MGGPISNAYTTSPSRLDSEETGQVTWEALQQKAALEDNPQREKTRSPEHRKLGASRPGKGEKRGGKISLSTDVPWPQPRQRGADFCLVPSPCICHLVYLVPIYSCRLQARHGTLQFM